MYLPVDALPRKSVPGLSQLGKITLPFRLASKITRGAMAMFRASSCVLIQAAGYRMPGL
jgi:hypothetical protein